MDIITGAAILSDLANQLSNIDSMLNTLTTQILTLAQQANTTTDVPAQIKSVLGSVNIQLVAVASQKVLVQQAADQLADIIG